MFSIDFKDIVKKVLPSFLRKTKRLEFTYSLIKPLSVLNGQFKSWKDSIDYDLKFNGQTVYLEHVLNDTFDNVSRRIYIEDTSLIDYKYLANKVEGSVDIYLANKSETSAPIVYFENKSEQITRIHFVVKVPSGLSYSAIKMNNLINKYKQAGKQHSIENF